MRLWVSESKRLNRSAGPIDSAYITGNRATATNTTMSGAGGFLIPSSYLPAKSSRHSPFSAAVVGVADSDLDTKNAAPTIRSAAARVECG